MQTERMFVVPATAKHLESLLKGETAVASLYDDVAEGYIEFPGALEYALEQLKTGVTPEGWGTYLFIAGQPRILIGIGGYKGAPDAEGVVEIGYGIALAYRRKGYATEAARALIDNAFSDAGTQAVIAHTLAETNPSTSVLQKCGMIKVAEVVDPDDGEIWRWEIRRQPD